IYIGGIELNKRARALTQGLKTADVSLKGCVRRLEVDSKPLGLGEAKSVFGPTPVFILPRLAHRFLIVLNGEWGVIHVIVTTILVAGRKQPMSNMEFQNTELNKTPLAVALEIIRLEPLTVSEGENTLLSSAHISLVLDAAR
ncbi:hypothetical protein WDU94_003531, partial [Cyamophila willieti]